jgi:hypothetical protein
MSQNVLSRNQKRALAALLEFRTLAGAAGACGLATKTLSRYLDDPAFRAALAQAEGEMIDEAGRTLIKGQPNALKTLYDLMTGAENESTRRLAAVSWLDLCLRWRELGSIEQRITALEQEVKTWQPQSGD